MNILFTIIVPVYNVEKYINQCLDSILNQTYNTIEIILVNDGSTDSSGLICDEYVNLDSRIKVIHQKNGGLSMARNTGLANANGEYVWFIDSDDWIVDNALQILADQIMQNESVEMISFSMIDFYENYNSYSSPMFLNAVAASDGNNFIASNKLFYAPACSYLYSFNFLKIYNFTFEPNMIHEDDYFNLNCMAQVKQICKIPYGLYYYRRRSNSIITSKASIKKIDSLIKLILLCQTLKKSTLDMVFLENQIFG